MTPVKCRSSLVRRLSDEACKELRYTRTHAGRRTRRCVRLARIPSCAKSHDKYTHVWRSTIITIDSEDEEDEGEVGAKGRRWSGRQSIYTHTQPVYAAGNTHTQDTRTGTAWGYTRAERPAHTVSLVYISEVPWPPPSVTTSYIPLCPPTPPPRPPSPPPLPPSSPAPPPPLAFCPSVSNLHSPPLALLTPPRPSIRRLLRVLIPQRRHPPNNPRCPSCEVSRTRVSFVRVSRVRRGGS